MPNITRLAISNHVNVRMSPGSSAVLEMRSNALRLPRNFCYRGPSGVS